MLLSHLSMCRSHTVAALASVSLLAGCVTVPETPQVLTDTLKTIADQAPSTPGGQPNPLQLLAQSLTDVDEAREKEIGKELSSILLGARPRHKDARLQKYVNQLGRWISLQSTRPDLPWTFVVLDDPGFNAFAAPGGYVFVTKGLVDQAQNEFELGGVLAHEIVHVQEKHHLKSLKSLARTQLAAMIAGKYLGREIGKDGATALLNLGKDFYAKGLDRDDEFDADRKGVTLAARAGLDPYGLPALLHKLSSARAEDPAYMLALATHPPTAQRLDRLEQSMGTRFAMLASLDPVPISQRLQAPAPQKTTSKAKK